jgi:hypothetical protein
MISKPCRTFLRKNLVRLLTFCTVFFATELHLATAATNFPDLAALVAAQPERIVDCLLPGRIHSLGGRMYQTPPRPDHIPAVECTIRGGEFIVYDRANIANSLALWMDLAEKGEPDAMRYVGEIYERGLGSEPNYSAAASWYQKAADAGSIPAKISLAQLYKQGQGVPLDPARAKALYADVFGDDDFVDLDPRSITPPKTEFDVLQAEIEAQREATKQLQADLMRSQQQLVSATNELDQRRQESDVADSTIARLSAEVGRTQASMLSNEQQLDRSSDRDAKLAELQQQLTQKEQEMGKLVQLLAFSESNLANVTGQLSVVEAQSQIENVALQTERDRLAAIAGEDLSSANATLAAREQAYAEQKVVIAEFREQNRVTTNEVARYQQLLDDMQADSVDIEALSAAADQKDARARQLEILAEDTNNQLLAAKLELIEQRTKSTQLEAELQSARVQIESYDVEKETDAEKLQRAIVQKGESEQSLRDHQAMLASLNAEISRVQQEADEYKVQLNVIERQREQATIDVVGPTIEIIDPSLMATRGLALSPAATIISTEPQRQIIGRVSAPAGLLSLTVNDKAVATNDRGVFKSVIAVLETDTRVEIVAIDEHGKRATKVIEFTTEVAQANATVYSKRKRYNVSFGNYHALLIGNADYENFQDLKTPIADVNAISDVLRDKYGFKTTVLHDATNKELFKVLYEDLLPNLTADDNLLIYYAGHGEYVEEWEAYTWLPVDAHKGNPQNYFWNDDLTKYLKTMTAKQILVIADSCYSGALTRDASVKFVAGKTDDEYERWLKKWSKKPARVALTSGGLSPVLDEGGGKHSVFARVILDILNENAGILPSQDLGQQVGARVSYAAEELNFRQEPEWAPINFTGHSGGDFFFVPEI